MKFCQNKQVKVFVMRCLKTNREKFAFLCFIAIGFTVFISTRNETCTLGQRVVKTMTPEQAQRLLYFLDTLNSSQQLPLTALQTALEYENGHEDAIHVLLNSYMRSGSSFLGRVLGHREDVFYYYEPLWTGNIWVYHKGIDKMCETLRPHCTTKPEELHISRHILRDIYACQLQKIGSKFSEQPHALVELGGEKWQLYHKCKSEGQNKYSCLQEMEQVCRSHRIRVTKVLRIDLTLANIILQDNPRLKMVHLFRDPRGSINSHVFTRWFPIKAEDIGPINMDAKILCERMKVDINAAISLQEQFPDRFKAIQYEDFYDVKEKAKLLYDFLGMDSTEKYLNFVLNLSSEKNRPVYNTTDNHNTKLFAYRDTLPWNIVQIVEKQCAEVISLLGLKVFGNEEKYMDKQFNPIDGHLKFGLRKFGPMPW